MSVRIVRLRNGEDVICDLYEVTTPENKEEVFALQLRHPYQVRLVEGLNADADGEIHKLTEPEIAMEPWMPLLSKNNVMIKMDEIVTAYETYEEVVQKYNELVEASNGGTDDSTDQTDLIERETRIPNRNSDGARARAELAN